MRDPVHRYRYPVQRGVVRPTLLSITLLATLIAVPQPSLAQEQKATEQLAELAERVKEATEAMRPEMSTPADLRDLRSELQVLLDRLDALAPAEESRSDRDEDSLTAELRGSLLSGLQAIGERLAAPTPATPFALPTDVVATVPRATDAGMLERRGDHLRRAQRELRAALQVDESATATEELVRLILAEERLAWAAGWPFTEEELEAIEAQGALPQEVYERRRSRGIEAINRRAEAEARAAGRAMPAAFVVHRPIDADAAEQLVRELGMFLEAEVGVSPREPEALAKASGAGVVYFDDGERAFLLSGKRY